MDGIKQQEGTRQEQKSSVIGWWVLGAAVFLYFAANIAVFIQMRQIRAKFENHLARKFPGFDRSTFADLASRLGTPTRSPLVTENLLIFMAVGAVLIAASYAVSSKEFKSPDDEPRRTKAEGDMHAFRGGPMHGLSPILARSKIRSPLDFSK